MAGEERPKTKTNKGAATACLLVLWLLAKREGVGGLGGEGKV
jgi:hypothetical protein